MYLANDHISPDVHVHEHLLKRGQCACACATHNTLCMQCACTVSRS